MITRIDLRGLGAARTMDKNQRLKLILEILHHTGEGAVLAEPDNAMLAAAIRSSSTVLDRRVRVLHRHVLNGRKTNIERTG